MPVVGTSHAFTRVHLPADYDENFGVVFSQNRKGCFRRLI